MTHPFQVKTDGEQSRAVLIKLVNGSTMTFYNHLHKKDTTTHRVFNSVLTIILNEDGLGLLGLREKLHFVKYGKQICYN